MRTDLQKVFKKIKCSIQAFNSERKWRKSHRFPDYKRYYTNDKMINILGDLFHDDIITFSDKF